MTLVTSDSTALTVILWVDMVLPTKRRWDLMIFESSDAARREQGVAELLARRQAEIVRLRREIADVRARIVALVDQWETALLTSGAGRPAGIGESSSGRATTGNGVRELFAQADSEVLSFVDDPDAFEQTASADQERLLERRFKERGVILRCLCLDRIRADAYALARARRLVGIGGEVRTVPSLPVGMTVVDRRVAVVRAQPDRRATEVIVLETPGAVIALRALFEQMWRTATALEVRRLTRAPSGTSVGHLY